MPQRDSDRLHYTPPATTVSGQPLSPWDHLERVPVPICVLDESTSVLEINLAARELLSISRGQLQTLQLASKIQEEDQLLFRQCFEQAWNADVPVECEVRMVRGDGAVSWVALSCARSQPREPEPVLFVALKDVSRSKENEQILRRSNDRFKHAIEATRDGIWDWDIPSGKVFFSPQWARLLGYEPDEVPTNVEFFFTILHPDDIARVNEELESHLSGKKSVKQDEVRLRTKSGEYRWFLDRGEVVERDAQGRPIRMVGTITDVTQGREARDSLLKSQSQTRLLIESARVGLWDWDILSNETYFSPEWKAQLGYADHELTNHFDEWKSRLHPDDLPKALRTIKEFFENRVPSYEIEFRLKHRDGSWRWIFARADVHRDQQGQPIRMLGCHVDITDRKEAEHAIRRSLSLMRATLESTTDGILVINVAGEIEICNQVFLDMWRVPKELIEDGMENVALPCALAQVRDPDQFLAKVQYLYSHPNETSFDTLQLKDGRVFERYSCPQMIDGIVAGRVWSFRDVTERRLAEAAQVEALNRLQKIASRLPGVVYQFRLQPDGTSSFPYVSDGMRELFGVDPVELQGNADATSKVVNKTAFRMSIEDSARNLTPWVHEFQVQHDDGSLRWYAGNSLPERDPDGSTIWHGFITDITDRRLADAKLRESERRLKEAQAISQIGNFHWDAVSQRVTWSDELYRLYQKDPAQFEPTFESYLELIHAEDRARVLQELQLAMSHNSAFDHQYRICLQDGHLAWVRARGIAIVDKEGSFLGLEGTCQDISEQKRVEATTASLEAQLRESQKMEAIGTLAGGIAHDFNNILASILGNTEIAIVRAFEKDPVLEKCLFDIRMAGDRARDLVQQILSFSRRQPTVRKPISLAPVIEEAGRLLSSTLPARLSLEVHCESDTPLVLADATQIEQVVLNLVTNSMQAIMGRRGHICIRLDTIPVEQLRKGTNAQLRTMCEQSSGPLVRVVVSDDGPGMSRETLHRIFEPFFTTKPTDEGTGLGLSVVHGIVQSHDGCIIVESQIDQGATFTIYLPSTNESPPADYCEAPIQDPVMAEASTNHCILYLDDDEGVLNVLRQILERRGYRLQCFCDTEVALGAFRNSPWDFDLVVTDYNMPGMHGLELAREVRKIRNDLPIIITSGFIDAELTSGASACGVQELIAKPFRLEELYAAIDRLISQPR